MNTIPVATFHERTSAERFQKRLKEAGFDSAIKDESRRERYAFLTEPLAAFHIEVTPATFDSVRETIAGLDATEGVLQDAVRCPECSSSRIEYPQISRKFLMPSMEGVLMAMHILPRRYYCCDCQYTWPSTVTPEPDLDLLGWPRASSE